MYKILIMDDDLDYLDSLGALLSVHNFDVVATAPTFDALSYVQRIQPNLIILDYLMGDVFGGEVCTQLKDHFATKHIPVIILTAYDKVFSALGNYGCDAFFSKTAEISQLIEEIGRLIR